MDANGQMLPEGGQAVFDMPNLAPVAPAAPKICFDSPSSSGEDVLVKFEIADYDVARDGPASIVLDSRLKALTIENPCTLVRSGRWLRFARQLRRSSEPIGGVPLRVLPLLPGTARPDRW